jgi:hypothetical protein
MFANVARRTVAAKVNWRDFHQSFSMRRNVRLDGETGGSRRKTLVPTTDRIRLVGRCPVLSPAVVRPGAQGTSNGSGRWRYKAAPFELFLYHRVALLDHKPDWLTIGPQLRVGQPNGFALVMQSLRGFLRDQVGL